MTKRTRRILFYLLTVLFFIIAISALFYSNGWRFDPETFTISTLGGIYFEKIPDGATLTVEKLDTKFNPGFLKSSVLIANLFPKTYTARVEKDGYQTWTKQITVKPSFVNEIGPIIIFPLKPSAGKILAKNIKNFWVGPQDIITQTQGGSLFFKTSKLPGTGVAEWSDDGNAVITEQTAKHFLVYLNNPDSALNLDPAFFTIRKSHKITDKSPIQKLVFQPGNNSVLIIQTGNGLYLFDADRFSVIPVATTTVSAFSANGAELLFAVKKIIYVYRFSSRSMQPLALTQSVNNPVEITSDTDGTYFTMRDAQGKLELVNRRTLEAKVIAHNAQTSLFAPNEMKIAFTTSAQEIGVYTFGQGSQLLDIPKTEILRISGEDERAISWHKNAAHLFINYPEALYLLEANDQPPINLQKIEQGVKKYFYDKEKNAVYLLKSGIFSLLTLE